MILTPIPLTLIGILIGHWLLGAPFTATSMIGFIALAGIIVRNSILLVDFIRHSGGEGKSLREVVLEAGAVRFKPILLTALAAMIGAATILLDPIFQGSGDLAPVRTGVIDAAHRARHSRDLHRVTRAVARSAPRHSQTQLTRIQWKRTIPKSLGKSRQT